MFLVEKRRFAWSRRLLSRGLAYARESAVSIPRFLRNGRGMVVFDFRRHFVVLNVCVECLFWSPPRTGGFQSARIDVAETSAAKRRLCVGARRSPVADRRLRLRRLAERKEKSFSLATRGARDFSDGALKYGARHRREAAVFVRPKREFRNSRR